MTYKTTMMAALLAATALSGAQAADPIKIGVVTPLSGTYAGIGQQVRWGLELATKEVNAAGGIAGRQVELIFEDEEANPAVAVQKADKLFQVNKVDFLTGTVNSGSTLAVGQVAVHVGHHGRAGLHAYGADAPGQAFAEIQVVAVMQRGAHQQPALGRDGLPGQVLGQAAHADLARRVLHGAAFGALLQLESTLGRGGGQAQRAAAADAGRARGLAAAGDRIFFRRVAQGLRHSAPLALRAVPRMAAAVHKPRS